MIDPLVSLAFAIYSNKNAYALLLGSGISRPSGIPTGWEVVIDLIRKVAALEGESCDPDPTAWFRSKYISEPDYSQLLDAVAKTPAERQQLLRGYFEPNEAERTDGLKLPSLAHQSIAKLVAMGYLRVIITTNFDRLMEKALNDAGVTPTVISTTEQLIGALPLAHSGPTLIKLHGDYFDTRIKNTEAELSAYDDAVNTLLDRIFDEYGLIISGWSGDWDIALRTAVERCPSRRFSTFWTTQSPLSEKAQALALHRQAVILRTEDANTLFRSIHEKIESLDSLSAPHPLSAKLAIATVKRYLVDPSAKIRLHDLVNAEANRLISALTEQASPVYTKQDQRSELITQVQRYDSLTELLTSILAVGSFWGEQQHHSLWTNTLQRIANVPHYVNGLVYLLNLKKYPALRLFYSAGIAAVAANNYATLFTFLTVPKVKYGRESRVFPLAIYPMEVMDNATGHLLPGMGHRYTPLSDYLFDTLRDSLRDYLPGDDDFQNAFDKFEFFIGVVHASLEKRGNQDSWWGPAGSFSWRNRGFGRDGLPSQLLKELEAEGQSWAPLQGGLFGGSVDEAKTAMTKFIAHLGRLNYH